MKEKQRRKFIYQNWQNLTTMKLIPFPQKQNKVEDIKTGLRIICAVSDSGFKRAKSQPLRFTRVREFWQG